MHVIDLTERSKMSKLPSTKEGLVPIELTDKGFRPLILEINTELPGIIMLEGTALDKDGKSKKTMELLTPFDAGRSRVKWKQEGPGALWFTTEGEVWWWTTEVENHTSPLTTDEQFTVISERRRSNPELERIAKLMNFNSQKRENMLRSELQSMRRDLAELKPKAKTDEEKAAEKKAAEEKAAAEKKAADEKAAAGEKPKADAK